MYGPTAYYFSRLVISILTFVLYPLICTLCMIWFLGLQVFNVRVFFGWFLDLWLISLVGNSCGLTVGCIVPDVMPAILYGNLICIVFNMGAGLLANVNSGYLVRFLGWISPQHYEIELLMRRLLDGRNKLFNHEVLKFLGYEYGTNTCYYIMIGMFVGYTLIGWLAIVLRSRN